MAEKREMTDRQVHLTSDEVHMLASILTQYINDEYHYWRMEAPLGELRELDRDYVNAEVALVNKITGHTFEWDWAELGFAEEEKL